MRLVVISYKGCWRAANGDFVTDGGFPFQMEAISRLFDQTRVVIGLHPTLPPAGTRFLGGERMTVNPVPEPTGSDMRRKIALLSWMPRNLPTLWREVKQADAVHAPVPGDLGTFGILIALLQRKPLFVRHCGTWAEPITRAERFLVWLLERSAGGRNVVMATGGDLASPSANNGNITWIHSTSLSAAEIEAIKPASPWAGSDSLRLVTVGRVSRGKNMEAAIRALLYIREQHPNATLTVLGKGPELDRLKQVASQLGVENAVDFRGNVSHDVVLETLCNSHLFLFPTRVKEGFPKAVLEAMACGLPVIATGVSVLPHLIGTQNGKILDTPTPDAVVEAVLSMTADAERMAEMGRHARETSKQYTLERWQEIIQTRLEDAWGQPLMG